MAAQTTTDWTALDGCSNASKAYENIVSAVEVMLMNIRLGDDLHHSARTIVAQLAHVHSMAPRER